MAAVGPAAVPEAQIRRLDGALLAVGTLDETLRKKAHRYAPLLKYLAGLIL